MARPNAAPPNPRAHAGLATGNTRTLASNAGKMKCFMVDASCGAKSARAVPTNALVLHRFWLRAPRDESRSEDSCCFSDLSRVKGSRVQRGMGPAEGLTAFPEESWSTEPVVSNASSFPFVSPSRALGEPPSASQEVEEGTERGPKPPVSSTLGLARTEHVNRSGIA
jgi:hypothetical protein